MLKLADLTMREDFTLGSLWVSPARRLIRGPAGETNVEPLTMQVFLVLADAHGQVVTRNHLYDECWGGVHVGDYSLNRVITMVRRIAAKVGPGAFTIESIPRTGYRLVAREQVEQTSPRQAAERRGQVLIGSAIVTVIAVAASAWLLLGREPGEPSIAIASADRASADLAAGIANAAMSAAVQYETPLRIVAGEDGGRAADFVLNVREAVAGSERRFNLDLTAERGKSLLWTWSATRPASPRSLDDEARLAGASALVCAAETRASGRPPDEQSVKLYLDACARFEPWLAADVRLLADAFEKITIRAPQLRGAWSKLYLSKAEAIEGFPPLDLTRSLRADIARAAARHIEVPETYIARAAILPLNARMERIQLYEAGLARFPRNSFLLSARSWQLRSLGRMDEAAQTARRLVELYPESPSANTEFVQSLMSSGRIEQARNVLNSAGSFGPYAMNLEGVRWRFEMRYGDPRVALSIARSGQRVVDDSTLSFIEARIDPSPAKIDRAVEQLQAAYREDPRDPGLLAQALGAFGRTKDAIQLLLHYDGSNSGDGAEMLFRPSMREVRRDRRFMQIAKNFGVTEYWRRSGVFPDFCFEPDLPYDCKRELAKIYAGRAILH